MLALLGAELPRPVAIANESEFCAAAIAHVGVGHCYLQYTSETMTVVQKKNVGNETTKRYHIVLPCKKGIVASGRSKGMGSS